MGQDAGGSKLNSTTVLPPSVVYNLASKFNVITRRKLLNTWDTSCLPSLPVQAKIAPATVSFPARTSAKH